MKCIFSMHFSKRLKQPVNMENIDLRGWYGIVPSKCKQIVSDSGNILNFPATAKSGELSQ